MESEYLGTALATDLGNPAKKVENSTLGGEHGRMGRRFPDGGLLRYRK